MSGGLERAPLDELEGNAPAVLTPVELSPQSTAFNLGKSRRGGERGRSSRDPRRLLKLDVGDEQHLGTGNFGGESLCRATQRDLRQQTPGYAGS